MKIQHDAPIRFSVKISKVDEETREVEGIATQEVLDAHNQVVDYESMKALVTSWPGNIREMHQPKAVGKAVSVETHDTDRSITVRARVSKGAPDTWEKVKEGVLSAFSIGGVGRVVTEKDATGHDVGRVFMQKWTETSLVDNPACPTAQFEICKSVNGELVGVQPAEPENDVVSLRVVGRDGKTLTPLLERLAKLATSKVVERPIHKVQVDGKAIEKRAEPYDVQQALQCIAYLESLVANEMFEAEYADVFGEGDNAATQKTEIGYLRAAAGLLLQFLVSEFDGQFAGMDAAGAEVAADVAMAKRREQLAAALEVFEKSLPASWAKADGSGSLWFAKAGARHSKKDLEMIQNMHDTSVGLGAVCEDADDEGDVENVQRQAAEAAAAASAERIKNAADDARAAATALATTQVLTPAAAVPAAATPDPAATTTVVVDKKIEPAPTAKVDEPAPAPAAAETQAQTITKLLGSIEALTKATEAQQAAHTVEVAELRAAIKKLEDQPMPGGPKTRATDEPKGSPAHKTLGNAAAGAADGIDADVIDQVLTGLIEKATDDGQRMLLVEKQLAHRRQYGIGMMRVERETVHPKPV